MDKFSIHKDTTVIVQRNGQIKCLHLCDVKVGDLIKGYDLNNNRECWNTVSSIERLRIPVDDQVRFWWQIPGYEINFVIVSENDNIDCWTYNDQIPWAYKSVKDVKVGDYLKGSVEVDNNKYRTEVFAVDYNCNIDDEFIALTLTNSYNFYARSHKSEFDPNVKAEEERRNSSDPNKKIEEIKHIEGYTKEFEDFVLVRANKKITA